MSSKKTETASHKPQIDKFREAARELETDDSEASFDHLVKEIAKKSNPLKEKVKDSDQ